MADPRVNTGIYLSLSTHRLLRAAAQGRQHIRGGRVSVSRIVEEIIDKHSAELRAEAEQHGVLVGSQA
jgi:hypothetical protein